MAGEHGLPDLRLPAPEVAPLLLGCLVEHAGVTLRLTEVEAYAGADDPASHAFRGPTRRAATMFGPAGRLYVYLSYGIHVCANVVTGEEGQGSAVLLRAGEIVAGFELARARRPGSRDDDLARGPGRLGRALALGLDLDGTDLDAPGKAQGGVRLRYGPSPRRIGQGPRIGISRATDLPWRWWDATSSQVSGPVSARRAPRFGTPATRA